MGSASAKKGSEFSPKKPAWLQEGQVGYVRVNGVNVGYIKAGSGKPSVLIIL